ncbi:MAG: hypothetical protein JNL34_17825 [Anaerolineae bacterium]|nr:hypothetical protein [Anaerolineae bacterium]
MDISSAPEAAAHALAGARVINAELLYQPRPASLSARAVFDHALRARLSSLTADDGLLLLVNGPETLASVAPLLAVFPLPRRAALAVNPAPLEAAPNTPRALGWETPERWQAMQTTDRWARLLAAFEVADRVGGEGWLALPALDAVYSRPLLDWLIQQSQALGGERPAAVSPVTPYQHYPLPGVRTPPVIVGALNSAFNRDETLPSRLAAGSAQGVWGKLSLIPRAACSVIRARAETDVWEDDREIDRVLREAGWTTRGLWLRDPVLYHQTPPVFDRAGLKAVIWRTLHYSLHIPAAVPAGTSLLAQAARPYGAEDSIWYCEARRLADEVTAECMGELAAVVARCGASWVDWGAYRTVARAGDPAVEVWRKR